MPLRKIMILEADSSSLTLERGPELRDIICSSTKNWEFNRLAFMDVIIMQIALAFFPDFRLYSAQCHLQRIPRHWLKVYSTPRSSSYINEMLDNIVRKLAKEGRTSKVREMKPKRLF